MKKILFIPVFLLLSIPLLAQTGQSALPRGNNQLNMGLGFNTNGFPVYFGADFAVHNNVTLGPLLNVRFNDYNTEFFMLGKVDFHWNQLMGIRNNFDFYTGGNIGGRIGDGFYLALGLQIGGRWYFSDKVGLNLEFAGGRGFGTLLGLSIRL